MSAPIPVTEAHRELARRIMFEFTAAGTATASDVRMAAQIIADSEERAVAGQNAVIAEWLNRAGRVAEERDQLLARLVDADQILDDIDTCSDAHRPMYSSYSQNVIKLCTKGRDARRAAIATAIKEAK